MKPSVVLAGAAVFLLASVAGGAAGDTLSVIGLTVRFPAPARGARTGASGGRIDLQGDFTADTTLRAFRPASDSLEVSVGNYRLLEGPAFPGRTKFAPRGRWTVAVRSRDPYGRGSAVTFRLDPANGNFSLKARGVDLAGLAAAGPAAVPVEIRVGLSTFRVEATLQAEGERRWVLALPAAGSDVPLPGTGDPPPDGQPLGWRHLVGYGGVGTPPWGDHTRIYRDQASFNAGLKSLGLAPTWPLDFTTRQVVGIFLGVRPSQSYGPQVTDVRSKGFGAEVFWTEWGPDPKCPDKLEPGHRFVLVEIPVVAGPVTFTRSTGLTTCVGAE